MKGMFFVHIAPDAKTQGRMNIRTGIVKHAVGTSHWLLEFHGKKFNFSNVIQTDLLVNFQFFGSMAESQAFIRELIESTPLPPELPPIELPPPGSEAPLPS